MLDRWTQSYACEFTRRMSTEHRDALYDRQRPHPWRYEVVYLRSLDIVKKAGVMESSIARHHKPCQQAY